MEEKAIIRLSLKQAYEQYQYLLDYLPNVSTIPFGMGILDAEEPVPFDETDEMNVFDLNNLADYFDRIQLVISEIAKHIPTYVGIDNSTCEVLFHEN